MYANEVRNPWPLAGTITAACVAVLVGGGVYVAAAMRPEPVTTPTAYQTFKAADGTFQCQYPAGWGGANGESHGIQSTALFRKGRARIIVDSSFTSSLINDMPTPGGTTPDVLGGGGEIPSGSGAAMPTLPIIPGMGDLNAQLQNARKPAIERVHASNKKQVELGRDEYDEKPAQPFQSGFGDARVSEYTVKAGSFGGKLHGFRASYLSTERGLSASCECAEEDWPKLKDAFWKVILSVSPPVAR